MKLFVDFWKFTKIWKGFRHRIKFETSKFLAPFLPSTTGNCDQTPVIQSCQKIVYNALFIMKSSPVSNFGNQSLFTVTWCKTEYSSNSPYWQNSILLTSTIPWSHLWLVQLWPGKRHLLLGPHKQERLFHFL